MYMYMYLNASNLKCMEIFLVHNPNKLNTLVKCFCMEDKIEADIHVSDTSLKHIHVLPNRVIGIDAWNIIIHFYLLP